MKKRKLARVLAFWNFSAFQQPQAKRQKNHPKSYKKQDHFKMHIIWGGVLFCPFQEKSGEAVSNAKATSCHKPGSEKS